MDEHGLSEADIAEIMSRQENWVNEAADEWVEKFIESGNAVEVTGSLALHLVHDTHFSRTNMAELAAIAVAALAKKRMQ